MASIASFLGLSGPNPPSLTGAYLLFHFFWAYGLTSARTLKSIYGIDHNVSPREDLSKYGPAAVAKGRLTQRQLDRLKRNEAAHANSYESYSVFAAALLWAHVAGLPVEDVNASALVYTIARVCYVAAYVWAETMRTSYLRAVFWWTGNIVCARLFWKGMSAVNAAKL